MIIILEQNEELYSRFNLDLSENPALPPHLVPHYSFGSTRDGNIHQHGWHFLDKTKIFAPNHQLRYIVNFYRAVQEYQDLQARLALVQQQVAQLQADARNPSANH